jgi:ubiquinone/menaquinone biosynthesis C-methylase UbiE
MKNTQEWVDLSESDLHDLLIHLIGHRFGPNPEDKMDEIRAERAGYMGRFIKLASIKPHETVLELGSGCGFGTRALATVAKNVIACDISPAYLDFAKRELNSEDNIRFELIKSRDLSSVADHSVDKVVSSAVFIHMNLYDIYLYLVEFKRILKPGGRVAFDFANMHRLTWGMRSKQAIEEFLELADHYRQYPESVAGLIQWNSARGIKGAARLAGFKTIRRISNQLVFESRS